MESFSICISAVDNYYLFYFQYDTYII